MILEIIILSPSTDRTTCGGCAPGKYTADSGCTECAEGKFTEVQDQSQCNTCPKGYYTDDAQAEDDEKNLSKLLRYTTNC